MLHMHAQDHVSVSPHVQLSAKCSPTLQRTNDGKSVSNMLHDI